MNLYFYNVWLYFLDIARADIVQYIDLPSIDAVYKILPTW